MPVEYSNTLTANEARAFVAEMATEINAGVGRPKMHIRTLLHGLVEKSLGQEGNLNDKESQLFDQVKRMIELNLSTVTVEGIEDRLHISPLHFRMLMKKKTNMRPVAYIIECRMQRSILLLEENLTLFEIAKQVGYSDQSAFSKAFLKWFGKWPTQVRNERKELREVPACSPGPQPRQPSAQKRY